MSGQSTRFTVVIPTRERADVLGPALQTVVTQDYDNLEILVSDNCSRDDTADVVRSFDDPRIRYVNTGSRFSMSHNWEFALSHVDRGWVAIIGDDDGLCPGAIQRVAEIVDEYKTRFVRCNIGSYIWPSLAQKPYGELTVQTRQGCEVRQAARWLARLIKGTISYAELPTLYTGGFADHRLIAQARDSDGHFYRSMVPDVYSAVVFARLLDSYVYCHEQLAIGGASKHSTGASQFSGPSAESADAAPAAKYYAEPNLPFHPDLAFDPGGSLPPSIQLLVYESILQSSHLPDSVAFQTSHEIQLEILLRNAKRRHRPVLEAWARGFATHHGLDFDVVKRRSSRIRFAEKLAKNWRKAVGQLYTTKIRGTSLMPLQDVYSATIAAATVRQLRKARLSRGVGG